MWQIFSDRNRTNRNCAGGSQTLWQKRIHSVPRPPHPGIGPRPCRPRVWWMDGSV